MYIDRNQLDDNQFVNPFHIVLHILIGIYAVVYLGKVLFPFFLFSIASVLPIYRKGRNEQDCTHMQTTTSWVTLYHL